jgi:hypothetical protein
VSAIVGSPVFRRAVSVATVAAGVLTIGFCMTTVPLDSAVHQAGTGGPLADTLSNALAVVPTAAVGTLLAARRPRNPIGWLMVAIILVGSNATTQYAILDYRLHHGTLPLGGAAVALGECWPLNLVFVAILLWIFPDGKLPSGRWRRPSAVLLVAGLAIAAAASSSGLLIVARHDVRIEANGGLAYPRPVWLLVLFGLVIAGTLITCLSWLVFQVPAYRRASGERRQQLKWLYSGAAAFVVLELIGVFIVPVAMGDAPGSGTPMADAVGNIGFSALGVCLGVAVLKYRLYELNRIISRVVAYTVITALLAGVFFGLVLLATRVLPFRTPIAVAASTLVIAALFNPLRRRVQHLVDRRFNRSRYDAEAIVAAFNARLQQTVDLDTVRLDLLGVTQSAFQPAHVSLWVTSSEPGGGRSGAAGNVAAAGTARDQPPPGAGAGGRGAAAARPAGRD